MAVTLTVKPNTRTSFQAELKIFVGGHINLSGKSALFGTTDEAKLFKLAQKLDFIITIITIIYRLNRLNLD